MRLVCSPVALVAAIVIAFTTRPADACDCAPVESPREAYAGADIVFVATVGATRQVGRFDYETTFTVSEVFRGKLGKTAVVRSRWNGGTCDHGRYPAGARMLIYALGPRERGTLYVSGCSGTKLLADAKEDLAYLRALRKSPTRSRGRGTAAGR